MSSTVTGVAHSGSGASPVTTAPSLRRSARPAPPRGLVGDLGDLAPVVARVRHEVLEDHLLDVAVARVHGGERLERGDALVLGLADADQDAARERDPQLARRLDRRQPRGPGAWSASRRARSPSGARRPTPASGPSRRSPRAGARGRRGQHAEVRVRQQPALERPLAGPDHIGGEVLVPVLAQPRARPRRSPRASRRSARAAPCSRGGRRRRAAARPRRARAGAPDASRTRSTCSSTARARERQRVVAREGDASHGRRESSAGRPPVDGPGRRTRRGPARGRLLAALSQADYGAAYCGGLTSWRRPLGPVSGVAARIGRALDEQVPVGHRRQHRADDRAEDVDQRRRSTRRPPARGRTSAPG